MYDESSHLIGEYTTSGASVVEYVWIDDLPIAAIKGDGTALALVTDRLGTLRRAYDANRSMVFSWDPDAFGVNKAYDTTGVLKLRFPGQVYDDRSGLHYNLNRYYSPWLGRYLEPDPLGLTAGTNPYVYANNDPVNTIDPDGLCPVCLVEGVAFVATRVAPVAGRYVYMNAPRIAGFIEGLSPAAAGSVSSAVALEAGVVKSGNPLIKAGSAGGETAGRRFPEAVKDAAKTENPTATCVYCQMKGTGTQVDHAIPRARGGNATLENAQLACQHCNASKGAGDFPKTPPAGYVGPWPPTHW